MPTELDTALNDIVARLTAPGGLLETVPFARFGRNLPMLKNAPPTLAALFETYCAQHGDTEFLVDGDIRTTFSQVYTAARTVAGGLVAGHGVQVGDRIGIAARNSTNWIVAYMAVLMAGGCATLLNGWWSGDEMAGGIELAGCTMVLADPQRAQRIADLHLATRLVVFDHDCPWDQGLAALLAKGGGADTPLPALAGDDLATILYTSGSTGLSKGAWSDHRAVVQGTFSYVAQTLTILDYLTGR
jgi:long-chain acyl-CoA synthetase